MTEPTNLHREQARGIVEAVRRSGFVRMNAMAEETIAERIGSALSSRDSEIREVLAGLKPYRSDCWCEPNGYEHSNACIAARALYKKAGGSL